VYCRQSGNSGGGGREQGGLDGQTRERPGRRALSQQAVAAKRDREREGDPRQATDLHEQRDEARRRAAEGDKLHRPQALPEHTAAEGRVEQRHEEIAEAALDHVAAADTPNTDRPVPRQERAARKIQPHAPAGAERGAKLLPTRAPKNNRRDENQRPDQTMGDQLHSVVGGELAPVERHLAPKQMA